MKAIEREYKTMLFPDRLVYMRNQEGLECRVRLLREMSDRYIVGLPTPSENGRAIRRMFKSEWRIVSTRANLYSIYLALGVLAGVIVSGMYIYINTR